MGYCKLFTLGWPGTEILPILASQVAGITGVSTVAYIVFLKYFLPWLITRSLRNGIIYTLIFEYTVCNS
jgi:hypothetical protein